VHLDYVVWECTRQFIWAGQLESDSDIGKPDESWLILEPYLFKTGGHIIRFEVWNEDGLVKSKIGGD
jgi:hypothetical protein